MISSLVFICCEEDGRTKMDIESFVVLLLLLELDPCVRLPKTAFSVRYEFYFDMLYECHFSLI